MGLLWIKGCCLLSVLSITATFSLIWSIITQSIHRNLTMQMIVFFYAAHDLTWHKYEIEDQFCQQSNDTERNNYHGNTAKHSNVKEYYIVKTTRTFRPFICKQHNAVQTWIELTFTYECITTWWAIYFWCTHGTWWK